VIFKAVLGIVAHNKNVKLGDGKLQSKLAGFIWAGASQEEKKKFIELAAEFKNFHKERFPEYEYKPRPRSLGSTFIDIQPSFKICDVINEIIKSLNENEIGNQGNILCVKTIHFIVKFSFEIIY
jgi:hypothetical protein